MSDDVEAALENKTQAKCIEIEKLETIEAEAEACTAIATKDEFSKESEREKHKKSAKVLIINCDWFFKEEKRSKLELMNQKAGERLS